MQDENASPLQLEFTKIADTIEQSNQNVNSVQFAVLILLDYPQSIYYSQ